MSKISKRWAAIASKISEANKIYKFEEAVDLLKDLPLAKFKESVDVCVMLGIDPSKFPIRGATLLPNGNGKTVRVAVFTQGANAELAKSSGADVVGMEDLAEQVKAGNINFDVVIASPDAMGTVGKLGTILGPRGLMPNPKVGTVTTDVATAVKNAKGGQVRYKADKNGIVHCSIGKIDFDPKSLHENFLALLSDLKKAKPSSSKGVYIKKITLTTTMGPGLVIDLAAFNK